jgi:hypothetical protein
MNIGRTGAIIVVTSKLQLKQQLRSKEEGRAGRNDGDASGKGRFEGRDEGLSPGPEGEFSMLLDTPNYDLVQP